MRICKYVPSFKTEELGRGVAFLVGSWNTLFYDILSAT